MPYELNGIYYTIDDLAELMNSCYSLVRRRIYKLNLEYITIGGVILVHEQEVPKLEAVRAFIETGGNDTINLREAARWIGISEYQIKRGIELGLPVSRFPNKPPRLTLSVLRIIADSLKKSERKTKPDWEEIIERINRESNSTDESPHTD